ncbi:hypothetical protein C8A00DRAFT_33899 [Chaetomidium leptoderma]|uniref:Uncharacterized protein n=1 Tax=Chaetomidium leptoderma TaxID=669021 RepID=A0AAN6VN92_9PEZI|nr:hypothetical protein C8A00DRAFT_33899 [Chaetomidium leptoderma]
MPPPSPTILKAAAASKRTAPRLSAGATGSSILPPPDALRRKPSAGILTTSTSAEGKRTARITTTPTACPAAATATATATTPPGSRHPLRLRDQNATTALRAVKPGPDIKPPSPPLTAARMPPYERPSTAGPRQPTVARAAVNKPPRTPKVAPRAPTPQHQPAVLATTPLARRPPADSTLSVNGNGSRDRDRDELTSPVSAFLNTNITPRSGSRQTRVDSASSTPNGTPNAERHDSWDTRSGLGNPATDDAPKRPVVTFSSPSEVGSVARPDRELKFFYASDAQKQTPQPTSTRPSVLQLPRPSTFFYANGNTIPERQGAIPPGPFSPPLASPSQDSLMSKFIYANGIPELQPSAIIGPSPQPSSGSVVSTASRVPTSRRGNIPRAASPAKSPQYVVAKTGTSIISPRSPISTISPQASAQPGQGKGNIEPQPRPKSHARRKSAAIIEQPPVTTTKRVSINRSLPSSGSTSPSMAPPPGLTLPNNPATTGFASLLQAAEDFAEPEEAQPEPLDSPTKTPQDGQVTELVANARRERKVQDLEITNASLEAINRTLERQLRKQTAELRRYQRLSRSGRLSMSSMPSRIPLDATVEGGSLARAGMGLDDLSEEVSEAEAEDGELEELEEDDDDMSSSVASGEMSPGATEVRHEKQRRDERRLELDISNHQQLLVDSQKINQSLKRCLGWTEELIKEGKRALEYQVRASDVELGGRVLAPEEVERRERGDEETEDTITLEDDTIYAIDALGGGSLGGTDTTTTWSKDPQDRDSGIELPADGG